MIAAVPLRDVEVIAVTYPARRWYGWRCRAGHLRYRLLATRGHAFPSFWLDHYKQDGFSCPYPLCKARTAERLLEKLRDEASRLGHVVNFREETGGL